MRRGHARRTFAIKAAVGDASASSFAFSVQKTMNGGKLVERRRAALHRRPDAQRRGFSACRRLPGNAAVYRRESLGVLGICGGGGYAIEKLP